MSYNSVHGQVIRERGRARTHLCISCGGPAKDWAYQYIGEPLFENGSMYSDDPAAYEPMCGRCHRLFDLEMDSRLRETYHLLGLGQVEYLAHRRETDPEFRAKMEKVGRELGAYTAQRRLEDPDFDRRLREAGSRNIRRALEANRHLDPEKLSADRARAGRVANAIRRRCLDCGLTAHPAAVGAHLKGSGHSGYETL